MNPLIAAAGAFLVLLLVVIVLGAEILRLQRYIEARERYIAELVHAQKQCRCRKGGSS